MKKNYLAPSMTVMEIHAASLLSGSAQQVRGITSDGVVGYGGAGDGSSTGGGSPRSRGFDGWDDEEDEDY